MKKILLPLIFLLVLAVCSASHDQHPNRTQSDFQKQWSTVLDLMQQPELSAPLHEKLISLVNELVDINAFDQNGLNIAMYASALGNLEVLNHVDSRSHSALLAKNPKTGLNILHFAAQATGNRGSAVLT
ncbi:MAG: hypothetical protein HQM10_22225 [Candidatus Riflebacteria bacterium]|nr:hypothetical protein [Candidatus Riflebacteria bacterium]